MRGIYWLAEELWVPHKGLWSMDSVSLAVFELLQMYTQATERSPMDRPHIPLHLRRVVTWLHTAHCYYSPLVMSTVCTKECSYRGADKSLARPYWIKQLKVRHFSSDAEVIFATETWLDGQPSEYFRVPSKSLSLVAVACFLPGRAKDLSAHRVVITTRRTSLATSPLGWLTYAKKRWRGIKL